MTEPDRIGCRIVGCRRTSKRRPKWAAWLCERHYRCDADLHRANKTAKKRRARIDRYFARWIRPPSMFVLSANGQRIADLAKRREHATFDAIVVRAQQLQDAGFWAPRPRRRKSAVNRIPGSAGSGQVASKFEDQFQRLKRAHAEGLL